VSVCVWGVCVCVWGVSGVCGCVCVSGVCVRWHQTWYDSALV